MTHNTLKERTNKTKTLQNLDNTNQDTRQNKTKTQDTLGKTELRHMKHTAVYEVTLKEHENLLDSI